jgi:hypothetical protein
MKCSDGKIRDIIDFTKKVSFPIKPYYVFFGIWQGKEIVNLKNLKTKTL